MYTMSDVVVGRADCMNVVAPRQAGNVELEPKKKYYYQDEVDYRRTYIYEKNETCPEERAEIKQFADILISNGDKAWLGKYIERYYLEEALDGTLDKEYIMNRCEGMYGWTEKSRTARRGTK